jgi:hypothetical protein
MSGVIVERRDQVLITGGRAPPERARSTAFVIPLSINGPFLTERAMGPPHCQLPICDCRFDLIPSDSKANRQLAIGNRQLFGSSILQDHLLRSLVAAGLVTTCWLTPGGYWVAPARSFAFTTTVRVIDWIHRDAANMGS